MILTVTCNPAIDITHDLPGPLTPGAVHRVREVHSRPGGKGVNVARVLSALGHEVEALGLGTEAFAGSLESLGVPAAFVPAMTDVRRTLVVQGADGVTTSLWEPGNPVGPDAGDGIVALVEARLHRARAVVVSGSLPPGLAVDTPVRIAAAAARAGVVCLLDLDGDALRAAARFGGAILTPNEDELALLSAGTSPGPGADGLPARLRALSERTGAPVVHTRGSRGLIAATAQGVWQAALDPDHGPVQGNPTGAGDAAAAGLALGLAGGLGWPATLREAVALGATAVTSPVAGEIDPETYRRLRERVLVEQLP